MQEKVLHFLPANELRGQHQRHLEEQELALPSLHWLLHLLSMHQAGYHHSAQRVPHVSWRQPKHPQK